MIEELESPAVLKVSPISVEHYHRMIDRGEFDLRPVELLNGMLIDKMSKSELHVYLVDLLMEELRGFGFARKIQFLSVAPNLSRTCQWSRVRVRITGTESPPPQSW